MQIKTKEEIKINKRREKQRRREERIMSVVNGEMIVCITTKQEYMEKKGDNTQE